MAEDGRTALRRSGKAPGTGAGVGAFLAGFDWLQILLMFVLLTVGLVFIHSTGAQVGTPAAAEFFTKQLTRWIPLGFGLWLVCSLLDYRKLHFKLAGVCFFLVTLAALALVLRYGIRVYGARRWLLLGSFRLQPSEFCKLALIFVLGWLFTSKHFSGATWAGIIAGAVIVLTPAVLICKEPDLGGTLILFPIAGGMLFVSGLKWRWLLAAALCGVLGFFILRHIILAESAADGREKSAQVRRVREPQVGVEPKVPARPQADAGRNGAADPKIAGPRKPLIKAYQRKRLEVFFKPNTDIANSGHNVYQSRLAVGAGGFWGKGIGNGTQNQLGFLPQTVANNDFIFSVIGEETGFMGSVGLLALYVLLLFSILRTAFKAPPFGRLLATGIAVLFFCHVYINIGMCIGLAPVTGLPLPLVSYGGSFIFVSMACLGVVQSVHRHLDAPEPSDTP